MSTDADFTTDDTQWAIMHSRFKDPLDMLAAVASDEPFVREMLATRERIARKYEEINASVPEGLSPRERDEYVSAQIMGSIGSEVDGGGSKA